jgi:hypothetical protein
MKKIYLMILLMSAFYKAFPQFTVTEGSIVRYSVPLNVSKDESVEGSPLLFEDWRIGKVVLKNHEQYDYVRLNFDAKNDKFYFNQHDTSFELLSVVEEIRVKDISHSTDSTYDMIFKNNITGGDVVKPGSFVQILSEGKITMFKQYTKRIEGENSNNGIVKNVKKYVLHTNIFAIVNNQVIPVKLSSHSLEELTSDKQDQMKAFVKSKQLNLKKEADFKQALAYYNSISSS